MEAYFQTLTEGLVAVVMSAIMLLIFAAIMGWLAVAAVKVMRVVAIHLTIARTEPKEQIIRRGKKRGRIFQIYTQDRQARA